MKLIIGIIHDDIVQRVMKELSKNKYRITKLSSTGGFLKSGNTTLLIGVEDEQVDDVVEIIKLECGPKENLDANVSGANIFVLNMDQFKRI